ncbi:MAG TPA: hypothetical protein PKD09_07645 [Aggregatilinea sp.]|uniref:hypothetical protein n=1 Tax=Aggregatilinea sp. TaxID=2806333 RepID=UPI002B64B181|nr:hypothetical protein [Aggregatilinea sp.]HML21502.1 hypothetical protein [Aggregatilinea sp.]
MNWSRWISEAVLAILLLGSAVTTGAQGALSADDEAAIAAAQAAFEGFGTAQTYEADVKFRNISEIRMTLDGVTYVIQQQDTFKGPCAFRRVPGNTYDDQFLSLENETEQKVIALGETTSAENEPAMIELIVVDDEIYVRGEADGVPLGRTADDWLPITGLSSSRIVVDFLLRLSGEYGQHNYLRLLGLVTAVEASEPVGEGGDLQVEYRFTLDPEQALAVLGVNALAGAYLDNWMTVDVPTMVDTIYTDPNTRMYLEVTLGVDDHALRKASIRTISDIVLDVGKAGGSTALAGTEMRIAQDIRHTLTVRTLNERVEIEAPDLFE